MSASKEMSASREIYLTAEMLLGLPAKLCKQQPEGVKIRAEMKKFIQHMRDNPMPDYKEIQVRKNAIKYFEKLWVQDVRMA